MVLKNTILGGKCFGNEELYLDEMFGCLAMGFRVRLSVFKSARIIIRLT